MTPNILIILDNSGSMNYMANGYIKTGSDAGFYRPDDFDPNAVYYGYFDSAARYTYNGTSNEFVRDNVSGAWNGNFLNWLAMRRVDVARKVLVGGKAGSRTGTGETVLSGEVPAQDSRKFFKFYSGAGSYTPYSNQYVYKLSKGYIERYKIDTPANFNYASNFKMYCNDFNGHDAYFEDAHFDYQGASGEDYKSYRVYSRKAARANGACDINYYDTGTIRTTLTYQDRFAIKVRKKASEEPNLFLDGNVAGILQRVGNRARFGLEYYNYDEGGRIANYIGSPLPALIKNIEDEGCNNWTPLAESLYEAARYFRQDPPYYSSSDYTVSKNNDPYYFQNEGVYVDCAKSFILLVTDGESTKDLNIPVALRDYDHDGRDPGTYPDDGSDYLDDVALWAHTTDARTGAKDLPGEQILNLYTIFAFGSGSQLLKDAAMNGGFVDMNGNRMPDLAITAEWDKNGDGIPDTYFEAADGNQLELRIAQAITQILQRAASGTSVSILSTSAEGEGSLYQAHFRPVVFDGMRKVDWLGYLNSLWVDPYGNLREDTVQDDALVYGDDAIIKFTIDPASGETAIARYHDHTGPNGEPDGKADSDTPYETVLVSELKSQWEAGRKLALKDASSRAIKTWVDLNGDGKVDTATEYIDFTLANAAVLRPFLGVTTVAEAEDIISFIRGEQVAGMRDRNITIGGTEYVWKLGDIIYSTPTVVSKPMERYNVYYGDIAYAEFFKRWKNRGVTVYVGANDGMLHAFKGGTFTEGDDPDTTKVEHGFYSKTEDPATDEDLGEERWAYIPHNLLPHLRWLTSVEYPHVYYVDAKPKVTDVRIFDDDADHPNGWGTILIGGMRMGGEAITLVDDFNGDGTVDAPRTFRSAYFVLDITNPSRPTLLGELTHPDMGLTISYPAVARLEASHGFDSPENDEWFAIMGSGPFDCDAVSNQKGRVFVYHLKLSDGTIDMDGAGLVQTILTSENKAIMASPVTMDLNLNYNVDTIYIGDSYVDGTDERGKMFRISTRSNNSPAPNASPWPYKTDPSVSPWLMTTLFSSSTPITASPAASMDAHDNIWVYFGTGKYYSVSDKTDPTKQRFYGIKDACAYGACSAADEIALADLYPSTDIIVLTNRQVIGAAANTWNAFVEEVQAKKGWYINLASGGERLLTRPGILGGVVVFAPYTPVADICQSGGTGAVYALYYETGTGYPKPILTTEAYGGDKKSVTRIDLGEGLTSEIGLHVGRKAESTGFIQQSTGAVVQVDVDPALNIKSGLVGWQQH